MQNNHRQAAGCVVLALVCALGCRGIAHIPDAPPTTPLALTMAEAERLQEQCWQVYQQRPRELERVAQVAEPLDLAARRLAEDPAVQVRAAQVWAYLAEKQATPELRAGAAKRGIAVARQARELVPDEVAGHYWYAINVGLLADVDRSYGLSAVGEMAEALKRAIALDEQYDQGGPLRLMAILHLRTPPPPIGVGSNRQGLRRLQRAVKLFPEYPENYLYLAEAQQAVGETAAARASLKTLRDLAPWKEQVAESEQWLAAARKLEESWHD